MNGSSSAGATVIRRGGQPNDDRASALPPKPVLMRVPNLEISFPKVRGELGDTRAASLACPKENSLESWVLIGLGIVGITHRAPTAEKAAYVLASTCRAAPAWGTSQCHHFDRWSNLIHLGPRSCTIDGTPRRSSGCLNGEPATRCTNARPASASLHGMVCYWMAGRRSVQQRIRPSLTRRSTGQGSRAYSSGNHVGCQVQVAKGDANEGSIKLLNDTPRSGRTFDHLSSVSAASSARLIRPLAKSRTRRAADIAGEV